MLIGKGDGIRRYTRERHGYSFVRVDVTGIPISVAILALAIALERAKSRRGFITSRLDIRQKHLEWYPELLRQMAGDAYQPEQDIWRTEFQLMRDGVKGFKLYAKPEVTDPDEVIDAELDREDLPHIGSVRKALHWAGQVFSYLTRALVAAGGRGRGYEPSAMGNASYLAELFSKDLHWQ